MLPPIAGVRRAVCPPPPHHTLSCTNLDLALVTTREEGSTLCSVSIIGKRYIGRTVLVMSDMKARLTSYTGHTVASPGQWSCVTSHKQGEEMWRGRHCSHHIAVCSVKHLSTQAMQQTSSCTLAISGVSTSDRSEAGVGILPHLTRHHPYYSGSGAGTGHRGRGAHNPGRFKMYIQLYNFLRPFYKHFVPSCAGCRYV